ncbi:MAG TPA: alpha/beta hydrolase [Clostridia bacterium]|nr:alpha/beta hydrolase [Clostridia bacterium]
MTEYDSSAEREKPPGCRLVARDYPARDGHRIGVTYYASFKRGAPLLLEVHGGGFVGGHNTDDAQLCLDLLARTGMNVASIEYRYAPEKLYPWATTDVFDALAGLRADEELDFDRARVSAIGHSAGGNIVAGLCLLLGDEAQLCAQVLDYPFLDATLDPAERPKVSYSIPLLMMRRFLRAYFPDESARAETLASPALLGAEDARRMPPTFLLTCDQDNLRSDGLRYLEKLRAAGVPTEWLELEHTQHAYVETVPGGGIEDCWWMSRRMKARQKECYSVALEEIAKFLRARCED